MKSEFAQFSSSSKYGGPDTSQQGGDRKLRDKPAEWIKTIQDRDKLRIIETSKVISVVDILDEALRTQVEALIPMRKSTKPLTGMYVSIF